jgi:hypothetical protein
MNMKYEELLLFLKSAPMNHLDQLSVSINLWLLGLIGQYLMKGQLLWLVLLNLGWIVNLLRVGGQMVEQC